MGHLSYTLRQGERDGNIDLGIYLCGLLGVSETRYLDQHIEKFQCITGLHVSAVCITEQLLPKRLRKRQGLPNAPEKAAESMDCAGCP